MRLILVVYLYLFFYPYSFANFRTCSLDLSVPNESMRPPNYWVKSLLDSLGSSEPVDISLAHTQLRAYFIDTLNGVACINKKLGIPDSGDSLGVLIKKVHGLTLDSLQCIYEWRNAGKSKQEILHGMRKVWLELERVYKWPALLQDYMGLLKVLLEDSGISQQEALTFGRITEIKKSVNLMIKFCHPQLYLRESGLLRSKYSGENVRVVVFDLFDPELLHRQRVHYTRANIFPIKNFGNPVTLSHGNSVIDVILSLAPSVTIIPIAASHSQVLNGFRYLAEQDFHIINISRPFIGNDRHIDHEFASILSAIGQRALISKAMGNSGTDLNGVLSPRRQELGLGPVGDLSSYDAGLIRDYVSSWSQDSKVFFTINADLNGRKAALTATIPGGYQAIYPFSLAMSAEGVFSWSSQAYESGSSFAAPQLAGVAALLFEAVEKKLNLNPKNLDQVEKLDLVYNALRAASKQGFQSPHTFGLGFLSPDHSLSLIDPLLQ